MGHGGASRNSPSDTPWGNPKSKAQWANFCILLTVPAEYLHTYDTGQDTMADG